MEYESLNDASKKTLNNFFCVDDQSKAVYTCAIKSLKDKLKNEADETIKSISDFLDALTCEPSSSIISEDFNNRVKMLIAEFIIVSLFKPNNELTGQSYEKLIDNNIKYYLGDDRFLNVRYSLGVGGAVHSSWIAFLGCNQDVQKGIYPCIWIDRHSDQPTIHVLQDVSSTIKPEFQWNKAQTHEALISDEDKYIKLRKDANRTLDGLKNKGDYNSIIHGAAYKVNKFNYLWSILEEVIENYKGVFPSMAKFSEDQFRNVIYFGAPGTGKSYEIDRLLKGACVLEDNIFKTTFHPEYDYLDFVGSYKPVSDAAKKISYEFRPGVFTKAIQKAMYSNQPVVLVIDEINRGNCAGIFGDLFQLLDRKEDGSSSYSIDLEHEIQSYLLTDMVKRKAKTPNYFEVKNTYFSFVTDDEVSPTGVTFENDSKIVSFGDECESPVTLKLKSESGMLEVDVYFSKDNNAWNYDSKVSKKLSFPSNFYIFATMNTSDQSLFPMDSAFKRRWNWKYVPIDTGLVENFLITIDNEKYCWKDFIEKVNEKIFQVTESEDKQLGPFFVNKKEVDQELFVSKVMFYLWNDVFKHEPLDNYNPFTCIADKDGRFSFGMLYDTKDIKKVVDFLDNLKVSKA